MKLSLLHHGPELKAASQLDLVHDFEAGTSFPMVILPRHSMGLGIYLDLPTAQHFCLFM